MVLCAGIALPAGAQDHVSSYIGSPWDGYMRALSVREDIEVPYISMRSLATGSSTLPEGLDHPWNEHLPAAEPEVTLGPAELEVLPATATGSFNSSYPSGGNDEAAWQGKGVNGFSTAGVRVSAPYVEATLAPQVWAAQNRSFPVVPPTSQADEEYGSFTVGVDDYQRPGGSAAAAATWGQSEIRGRWRTLTAGFGTQSVWLGPAEYNPILLGTNAAGFPRMDVTLEKTETPIGAVEAAFILGRLEESAYFNDDSADDYRLLSVGSLSYAPSFLPGFSIGLHRMVFSAWQGADALDALQIFDFELSPALGDDERDQRLSFTLDWRFPQVGFNIYAEWARNDYSPDWRFIVRAPEHSQAFTIGGRQTFDGPAGGFFLLSGEITQLILSRDYYIDIGRGRSTFYSHGALSQGHTHLGQGLGAPVGPGGAGQRLGLDYFGTFGSAGLFVERTARNQNYLYGAPDAGPGDIKRANVEMRYGARGTLLGGRRLTLASELSIARNINRTYEAGNDVVNFYGMLEAVVRP